jgi:hypothetical protein
VSFVPGGSDVIVSLRAPDGLPIRERTVVFIVEQGASKTSQAVITDGAGQARLPTTGFAMGTFLITAHFAKTVLLPDNTTLQLTDPLYEGSGASQSITISATLSFSDEQAWLNYGDATVPGATSANAGLSKAEILGAMTSANPQFGPNSILASDRATRVTVYVYAQLSGKTIAHGEIPIRVQANDNLRWRGDAMLNGARVEVNADWDNSGGSGKYHVWIYPSSGSGPLYKAVPAVLTCEVVFGTGNGEHPTGGISQIGGADKPWTQENGNSRVRSN